VLRDWRGIGVGGTHAEVVDRGIGFGRECVMRNEIKTELTLAEFRGAGAGSAGGRIAESEKGRSEELDLSGAGSSLVIGQPSIRPLPERADWQC
jgi:hypothetical protein